MFETPEEMQAIIDKYFEEVKQPTISDIAVYLGFADRYSLYEYEKKPLFTYTIKRLRARITAMYERAVVGNNAAGPIFMLKNLGYSDKQEIDLNANVTKMDKIKVDGKEIDFDIGDGDESDS
jgi:hypothetical protein